MTVAYWPTSLPQSPLVDMTMTFEDVRTVFEPNVGPPISRPKTTGAMALVQADFMLTGNQLNTFDAFYEEDTAQGSTRFIWRDPISGDPEWWRFAGSEGGVRSRRYVTKNLARVSLALMRLPQSVWFAGYMRAGISVVPSFVADYVNDVYGIDGEIKTAADMPGIAGTYDLYTKDGSNVETFEDDKVVSAGDIPSTQPVDVNSYVGFPTSLV